ncbi:hypothetical protein KC320_g278 [Hortaea werneckii]|nr:hypothetical protein KC320_g278 [Hortaea werneckii]
MTRCNGGMERTRGMPDGILCLFHNIVISRSGRFRDIHKIKTTGHRSLRTRAINSRSPKDHLLDREHRSVQAVHL